MTVLGNSAQVQRMIRGWLWAGAIILALIIVGVVL
jgi:hypothetical protein